MAHEPKIFRRVPESVSLILCGHTHGGQINLFGHKPVSGTTLGKSRNYGYVTSDPPFLSKIRLHFPQAGRT